MLNNKEFDLWADGYENTVRLSCQSDEYPFAGYDNVLNNIYNKIKQKNNAKILDIGLGTGILSKRLYDEGCIVYGIDFSEKMIEIAKEKMPKAQIINHDFTLGYPERLNDVEFDFIVLTYSVHHLDDEQKTVLLTELKKHLSSGGRILIGDVAFKDISEMEACRQKAGEEWDDEEIYIVYDELKERFPESEFEKISYCSAVISL